MGDIAYIFCSDERILEVNRQYLQHDYYTDIITFDYCEGNRLSGDLFISLDTVRTNAQQFAGGDYARELHRVIIHGILHLCGLGDKGPGERELMEQAEDHALALLHSNATPPATYRYRPSAVSPPGQRYATPPSAPGHGNPQTGSLSVQAHKKTARGRLHLGQKNVSLATDHTNTTLP